MVTMNKVKIEGPVVTKTGRATKATKAMLAPATKSLRKAKVAVVIKPKNPIQIRHIRGVQPKGRKALVGTDKLTICGRIVCQQMTRVKVPTGLTVKVCPECVDNTHENEAFEIVA